MDTKKIGFIGGGNMALAVAQGLVSSGKADKQSITICEVSQTRREQLMHLGFKTVAVPELFEECYIIFLAVKPAHAQTALAQLAGSTVKYNSLVSIVAGLSTEKINEFIKDAGIIRIMPNTPALVCRGMFAVCDDYTANDQTLSYVKSILSGIGEVMTVPARLMDAVTAVSGSGPAYVFMFIDAIAGAGVRLGLTREQSLALTLQTIAGSVEMVRNTQKSPSDLKDMVCSPAGTTIEAVYTLEKGGFTGLIMEAVEKCGEKSREISAKS